MLPGKPRVEHVRRVAIPGRVPAHVTLRFVGELPTLRTRKAFTAVARAFWGAQGKFGMRLVHFSVQSNHLHVIVEGVSAAPMKGLGVRIARGLNRVLGRSGRVIGDRYHAHALRTPAEVRNAVHYIRNNHRHHQPEVVFSEGYVDPFSSEGAGVALPRPRTWLVRQAAGPPG